MRAAPCLSPKRLLLILLQKTECVPSRLTSVDFPHFGEQVSIWVPGGAIGWLPEHTGQRLICRGFAREDSTRGVSLNPNTSPSVLVALGAGVNDVDTRSTQECPQGNHHSDILRRLLEIRAFFGKFYPVHTPHVDISLGDLDTWWPYHRVNEPIEKLPQ